MLRSLSCSMPCFTTSARAFDLRSNLFGHAYATTPVAVLCAIGRYQTRRWLMLVVDIGLPPEFRIGHQLHLMINVSIR